MPRLENKVALITGGANGLGHAIAARMAEEGATIVVLDVDQAGERSVATLGASGNASRFITCDVTQEGQIKSAMQEAFDAYGRIDILVNNAGIEGPNKTSEHYELADWERVFAVNSTGVFLCTKHAVPHMRAGGGSIVNISSIYGMVGGGDVAAYHASKAAVRVMTKNDALAFAPDNIRANSIHPGFIPTSMVDRFVDDTGLDMKDARPMLDDLHPLGGMGTPDDVAWGVVYLASDEARWVTGTELVIDGGYTAR